VAYVEVGTLNVDVDFRLEIDLLITWPGDTKATPATYTTYFKNAYDASVADADAAAQKSADVSVLPWNQMLAVEKALLKQIRDDSCCSA
jgi:hypothetical protein